MPCNFLGALLNQCLNLFFFVGGSQAELRLKLFVGQMFSPRKESNIRNLNGHCYEVQLAG